MPNGSGTERPPTEKVDLQLVMEAIAVVSEVLADFLAKSSPKSKPTPTPPPAQAPPPSSATGVATRCVKHGRNVGCKCDQPPLTVVAGGARTPGKSAAPLKLVQTNGFVVLKAKKEQIA